MVKKETGSRQQTADSREERGERRKEREEKRKTLRRPVVYCQHLVLSPFFRYH